MSDTGEATPASTPTPLAVMAQGAVGGTPAWMAPPDTSFMNKALDAYLDKGREQSEATRRMVERGQTRLDENERLAAEQAAARKAAMPGALALPNAPSMKARGFLDPGPDASVLQQLQSVMLGIGVIGQQWSGLRGSATAAVSALRGAFQGWAEGDHERANRELKKWQADTEKLLAEHKDRVESYQRIWDDQQLSWSQRMDLTAARSRLDGFEPMILASEKQDIGQIIDVTGKQLQWGQQHMDRMTNIRLAMQARADALTESKRAHEESARHNKATEEAERRRADEQLRRDQETRRQHEVTERNAAAQLQLAREREARQKAVTDARLPILQGAKEAMKLSGQELQLTNRLRQTEDVERAVKVLSDAGVIPETETAVDKFRAKLALQTTRGEKGKDVAEALNTIKRQATALVVGAEMSLGNTASVMRLKVIGEAEAGGIAETPKAYWDHFLPMLRRSFTDQLEMTRRNLRVFDRAGRLAGEAGQESADDPLGILR